ncbi:MAG: di-heme-cytochrome C peroxidase [Bdellovibrionota bacterium]
MKNIWSKGILTGALTMSFVSIYAGCVHSPFQRDVAGQVSAPPSAQNRRILEQEAKLMGGTVKITPGLTNAETMDLWHLSEGSEVFPLAWFIRMQSQFSHVKGTVLSDRLDEKFNVISEYSAQVDNQLREKSGDYSYGGKIADKYAYPFKWVGVTAAWSGEHPTKADIRVMPNRNIDELALLKQLPDGTKSIAMVGVNCAFCHTNLIKLDGREHLFEGAPAMLNIRGFFQDMFASTAKTMLTPELLEQFLGKFPVQGDVKKISQEFSASLKKDLGLEGTKQRIVGNILNVLDSKLYEEKKTSTLREKFFEKREVVVTYLVKLLQLTYGMDEVPNELKLRMRFLANSIGVNPDLPLTAEGYSRTDAFGRISNLVARTKNPIPLTATTSVPPMWRIEYRSHFHWNSNTNSVVMRNLGQSFGLGALLTNQGAQGLAAYDSTTNLHNLHRLEELLYKIETPRWSQVSTEIDIHRAIDGCNTFFKTCAGCHMPQRERVGPVKALINYKYISQNTIGTDEIYNKNQATPVEGVPFKDALFNFTRQIRNRYYERYSVDQATQAKWEKRSLRGEEIFRDTSLGESGHQPPNEYMNIASSPTPGYPARHLAGAWATAPYLHNGSVPNLYELLKPSYARPKMFFVGNSEYDAVRLGFQSEFESLPPIENLEAKAQALMKGDKRLLKRILSFRTPKPANIWEAKIQVACTEYPERCFNTSDVGNSNAGHEGAKFGTDLSEQQKAELIEFLKVLRPEPEYSSNAPLVYTWNGQSCEAVP